MSFNRSGYIGRAPGDSSVTLARKVYEPTGVHTDFTFSAGYDPGYCDVYLNGIRLINGTDYTASNGSTVGLTSAANSGDIVEIVAYKAFNLGQSLSDITGDLSISGNVSASSSITADNGLYGDGSGLTLSGLSSATFNSQVEILNLNVTGFTTTTSFNVGSATTIDGGGVNVTGVITATSFSGDGTNITGVVGVGTLNVRTESITVSGVSTFTGAVDANATTDSTSSTTGALTAAGGVGIAKDLFVGDAIDVTKDLKVGAAVTITGALSGSTGTFSGAVSGSTGTFSGAVNVDDTTDSTSATSGSLIVDGGLGVAKNVYIGAGLSVAGTLTYEDVTSVDSVGMVTAKSGVNITGGELTVGSGITMGIAGVATFSGTSDVHLHDNIKLLVGDASDFQIFHNGTRSKIQNNTGELRICSDTIQIKNYDDDETFITATDDGAVELYNDNSKKFETFSAGVRLANNSALTMNSDSSHIYFGADDDMQITHNGSHGYINNSTGNFVIKVAGSEESVVCVANAEVDLHYNNATKFVTTNDGTVTTGIATATGGLEINADSKKLQIGAGSDLQLYHDATNTYIKNTTGDFRIDASGPLMLRSDDVRIYDESGAKLMFYGLADLQTQLYYNNSKKFETTNDGVSITGICTATDFSGASGGAADFPNGITASGNIVINTDAYLKIGIGNDLQLAHNGTNSYVDNSTGHLYIRSGTGIDLTNAAGSENYVVCTENGSVKIYYDHSNKFETTNDGVNITGVGTFSQGANFAGMLKEEVNIVAGKLSDNTNIDLENGMVHYFSTNETTTATPNIRWNSTYSLNSKMNTGDVVTVTIIYKPNGAGYYAALNIGGSGQAEEWNGGSAPSSANDGGYDVLTHTIIKTGSNAYIDLCNVQNYA